MKELLKKSGIYQIRNTVNGKIYVGSATSLKKRRWLHMGHLRRGTHHSQPLQRAYAKYGEGSLVFEPLITCSPIMLLHYEQQFIDQWKPEYNVCKIAGSCKGRKHRPESIAKMCTVQAGRGFTIESRVRMSEGQKTKESMTLYELDGVAHSMSEWSKLIGVSIAGIYGRIHKRGWDVRKALTTPCKDSRINHLGRLQSVADLAQGSEVKSNTIHERIKRGWSVEKAVANPVINTLRQYGGVCKSLREWAEEFGVAHGTLKGRLKRGWTMHEALTTTPRGIR